MLAIDTAYPAAQSRRGFVARWIRATALGWIVGFALVLGLLGLVSGLGLGDTQFALGLGMGAGMGLLQMRVLPREGGSLGPVADPGRRPSRRSWLVASAVGLTVPFLAWDVINALTDRIPYSLPTLIVAGGLLTGVLQWRLLRGNGRDAGRWIVAATLGWCISGAAVLFNDRFLPRIPGLTGALLYVGVLLLGGVLMGVVGGPVLAHILFVPLSAPADGSGSTR